jgi:NAD(P)-dependent dehydrogenase (short-subunit alcohol dehydrogenase family)
MELRSRVAVVIGGGSGIGQATAELLAQRGAVVAVAGRRQEPLDRTVAAIRDAGGQAIAVSADLTREADARAVVDRVVEEFGRLELAVNAAGGVGVGQLVATDEAVFDEVIAANVKSTWLAMKYQIPAIATSGGGAIVNVSSRAGLVGTANGSVYSAAKHAVIGLTKSAALEVAGAGIRVNAVCPGPTRTEQFERIVERAMPGASTDVAATQLGAKLPLGRIAQPSEIAAAAVWLLGPGAAFITGAAVPVDGGGGAG